MKQPPPQLLDADVLKQIHQTPRNFFFLERVVEPLEILCGEAGVRCFMFIDRFEQLRYELANTGTEIRCCNCVVCQRRNLNDVPILNGVELPTTRLAVFVGDSQRRN
jgi:hypothetical protein